MLALRPLISALIVLSSATPLIGAPDAAWNFRAAVAKVDITRLCQQVACRRQAH